MAGMQATSPIVATARIAGQQRRAATDTCGPTPSEHQHPEHRDRDEVRAALEHEEGDGVPGDLVAGHPALAQRPGAERQPAGAARGHERARAELRHPELVVVRHVIRAQKTGLNMRM